MVKTAYIQESKEWHDQLFLTEYSNIYSLESSSPSNLEWVDVGEDVDEVEPQCHLILNSWD